MRDGRRHVAGGLVGGRQVAVELGLVRLDRQGLADEVDGRFRLADLVGDDAEQVQGIGLVGVQTQHLPVHLLGLLQVAGLMELEGLDHRVANGGHEGQYRGEPFAATRKNPRSLAVGAGDLPLTGEEGLPKSTTQRALSSVG